MTRRNHAWLLGPPSLLRLRYPYTGRNKAYNCKESSNIEKLSDGKHRASKPALFNDINL